MCPPFFRADQRAIVDNHRQRGIDLAGHRHGKVVSPSGDQRHLDAAPRRFRDRRAVGRRELPAAVEQRAVDVQSNQTHCHISNCTVKWDALSADTSREYRVWLPRGLGSVARKGLRGLGG